MEPEQPNKKRRIEENKEDEFENVLPDSKQNDRQTEQRCDLRVSLSRIKDFCSVLQGFNAVPNLQFVKIEFNETGMNMYAKPKEAPVIVTSFFNTDMFEEYYCNKPVSYWVSKARLELMRKKIKDIKCVQITCIQGGYSGFCFSGVYRYNTGVTGKIVCNIYEWDNPIERLDLELDYNCLITTVSQQFKHNVDLLDDKSAMISIRLLEKHLIYEVIDDGGLVNSKISHQIDNTDMDIKFDGIFWKKFLRIITSAQDLHPSLLISFNNTKEESYPILFHYDLDTNKNRSHFSAYIMPCITENKCPEESSY